MTCEHDGVTGDHEFSETRRTSWLILSPICMFCIVLIIWSIVKFEFLRRPPCRLVIYRYLLEFLFVSGLLFSAIFEYDASDSIWYYTAIAVAQMGMICYTVATLWDVVLISRNPFDAYRYDMRMHIMCWLSMSFLAGWMITTYLHKKDEPDQTQSDACIAREVGSAIGIPLAMIIFVFLFFSICIMIAMSIRLSTGLPMTLKARNDVVKQQMTLTIGFAVSDLVTCVPSLIDWWFELDVPSSVSANWLLPLRVFWDCLVFLVVNKIPYIVYVKMRNTCCQNPRLMSCRARVEQCCSRDRGLTHEFSIDVFSEVMRHELVLLTALGIAKCAEGSHEASQQRDERHACQSEANSSVVDVDRSMSDSSQRSIAMLNGLSGDDNFRKLVAHSATRSVGRAEFLAAGFSDQEFDVLDWNKDEELDFAEMTLNASWHHNESALSGSNESVSSDSGFCRSARTTDAVGLEDTTVQLARAKTTGVPRVKKSTTGGIRPNITIKMDSGKVEKLEFYDYHSEIFATVRHAFGIKCKDYHKSFAAITDLVDDKTHSTNKDFNFKQADFKEVLSSGASGSYFYFTPDKKYIVKQVSKIEKENMSKIAKSYMQHCCRHKGSTIHYYGLHSIRLPFNTGKMYFVVMKNFLYSDQTASPVSPTSAGPAPPTSAGSKWPKMNYDLKGATTNRQRLYGVELAKAKRDGEGSSLLDWDWINLDCVLDLEVETRRKLAEILRADLQFLSDMKLVDYSILLGYTPPRLPAADGSGRRVSSAGAASEGVPDEPTPRRFSNQPKFSSLIELNPSVELESHQDTSGDEVLPVQVESGGSGIQSQLPDVVMIEGKCSDSATHEINQPISDLSTGTPSYCLGMIDILEMWDCGWKTQGCILGCICWVFGYPGSPQGITAIHPEKYAWRFDEYMQDKVLRIGFTKDNWRRKSWKPWK